VGETLLKYYKYVVDEAGLQGKTKLAIETKIPSTKAAMEADSPATIAVFEAAVSKITGKPAPHLS
jgi:hypothetical protein